ncbi:MAG: hypothetical protein HYY17_10485 [Planctomycetes bacterium]|nr:hypothetical protein [Planctomycetota bacterium]
MEDRLKSFKLAADAAPQRERVLRAARAARRERRLWRWTWVAAAIVLAVAIPMNLSLDGSAPPTPNPLVEREVAQFPEELRPRARLALAPRGNPRVRTEVESWR